MKRKMLRQTQNAKVAARKRANRARKLKPFERKPAILGQLLLPFSPQDTNPKILNLSLDKD